MNILLPYCKFNLSEAEKRSLIRIGQVAESAVIFQRFYYRSAYAALLLEFFYRDKVAALRLFVKLVRCGSAYAVYRNERQAQLAILYAIDESVRSINIYGQKFQTAQQHLVDYH